MRTVATLCVVLRALRRNKMRTFLTMLGIIVGVGAARLIAARTERPTLFSPTSAVMAFAFSGAVEIFFGFYPAHKASRLDPIKALRYE